MKNKCNGDPITDNRIGDQGGKGLWEMLKVNKTMTTFYLSSKQLCVFKKQMGLFKNT